MMRSDARWNAPGSWIVKALTSIQLRKDVELSMMASYDMAEPKNQLFIGKSKETYRRSARTVGYKFSLDSILLTCKFRGVVRRGRRGACSFSFYQMILLTFHIVECLASPTSSICPPISLFRTKPLGSIPVEIGKVEAHILNLYFPLPCVTADISLTYLDATVYKFSR